jgi:hypothetical protein
LILLLAVILSGRCNNPLHPYVCDNRACVS